MKPSEFIKRLELRYKARSGGHGQDGEGKEPDQRDHSLRGQAKEHAEHPEHMHAGTAFDWEDLEAYQRELERMDREGPGSHGSKH